LILNFGNLYNTEKLTEKQKKIFASEMKKQRKSGFVAFVLWLFLGLFGAHSFYLGKTKIGVLKIIIFFFVIMKELLVGEGFALLTVVVGLGYFSWTLVDVVFLKKMLRECNERIAEKIRQEVLSSSPLQVSRASMTDSPKTTLPTFRNIDDIPKKVFPGAHEFFNLMQFNIQNLVQFYNTTNDRNLQIKIKNVHAAIESVLEYIRENPEYVYHANKLTNIYLQGAIQLLEDYIPMEQQDILSEETAQSAQHVKNTLDGVEKYARSLLDKLYHLKHNEIRDNSKVLNRNLQMEGIPVDVGRKALDEET
jgi:TM2 domain-containing membrane protein YozV